MSARRDPAGRWPAGGGVIVVVMIGLMFWATMAVLLAVSVLSAAPDHDIMNKEKVHADL